MESLNSIITSQANKADSQIEGLMSLLGVSRLRAVEIILQETYGFGIDELDNGLEKSRKRLRKSILKDRMKKMNLEVLR